MITTTLFCIGYVVCGILAYGVAKNNWRQFYCTLKWVGYDKATEALSIVFGLLGFAGLITATILTIFEKRKLGLCYKMPTELLNTTREAEYEAYMQQLTSEITRIERHTEQIMESISQRPIGRG